jgi:hypothetical protein
MLNVDPFWGKGYFLEERNEGKKGQLEGKETCVREA